MYETSNKWKENIYSNIESIINIYFDDILINPQFITGFKKSGTALTDLSLGGIPTQNIELQIHKKANISIPKRIKVEYGLKFNEEKTEVIPIGIYNLDDYNNKEDNIITIKALDNMIRLEEDNGYYDASELINKKGYATLGEIADDICKKKGLELGSKSFINSNQKIYTYDNSISAREYIGYIAECAGCFACAGRDGKIYFRKIGQNQATIALRLFKTYKFSEEVKISRVAYENGVESFKFGDETRNTLWLNQENLFITEEQEVENIYNSLKDLTFYSFEGSVIIDPALDIGDILIIDDKPIIYQGEISLAKRFIANIKSTASSKQKSETTTRTLSQKVINRRVQSQINEAEGKIIQLVQETNEHEEKITKVEQDVDSIKQNVGDVVNYKREAEGITKVNFDESANKDALDYKIRGNKTYENSLFPRINLYPRSTLHPNQKG